MPIGMIIAAVVVSVIVAVPITYIVTVNKLKNDAKYAIQRFCSLGLLSEYSIRPAVRDYDLYERGALVGSDSLEKLTETMIAKKNERRNTCF